MSRMLLAPGRYIQGAGAIHETGEHAVKLGKKALLAGGYTALAICGDAIQASLAKAPPRFLVAGMGDALATFWETDTCSKSCKPNALTGATPPTLSALALARLSYDILLEYGVAARLAVERGVVTRAVEAVVEANTLLSGLGFESGGLGGNRPCGDPAAQSPAGHPLGNSHQPVPAGRSVNQPSPHEESG
jgi:glycerol dehydrogenase-like iron-containing ADH family enzyme